jgi:hypothetical protein
MLKVTVSIHPVYGDSERKEPFSWQIYLLIGHSSAESSAVPKADRVVFFRFCYVNRA